MFREAIVKVSQFTRPIHTISRNYNSDGWVLTCRHVAEQLLVADTLAKKRVSFNDELTSRLGQKKKTQLIRELTQKYGFNKHNAFEMRNRFIECFRDKVDFDIRLHKKYDIALIHFVGYSSPSLVWDKMSSSRNCPSLGCIRFKLARICPVQVCDDLSYSRVKDRLFRILSSLMGIPFSLFNQATGTGN